MLTAGAGLGAVESERGRIAEAERLKATTSVLVARNQWAAAVGELNSAIGLNEVRALRSRLRHQ